MPSTAYQAHLQAANDPPSRLRPRLEDLKPDKPVSFTEDERPIFGITAGGLIAPLSEEVKRKATELYKSGELDDFEKGWCRAGEAVRRVLGEEDSEDERHQ